MVVLITRASDDKYKRIAKMKKENFCDFLIHLQNGYFEPCIVNTNPTWEKKEYGVDFDVLVTIYDSYVE